MADFDLDLGSLERELDGSDNRRIVLGILDGETDDDFWLREIEAGNVLVFDVVGDLNELASGFAGQIKDNDGSLVHFRGFLIVTPPDVSIDTEQLE